MINKFLYTFIGLLLLLTSCKKTVNETTTSDPVVKDSIIKYTDRFDKLLAYPVDSMSFPRSSDHYGKIKKVPSKDWTSGFFPGSLWYIYKLTGNQKYLDRAKEWTTLVEKEKSNNRTHDMGFKIFCSYGNGYRFTKDTIYKNVIIESAKTLSTRYREKVGAIRSWDFNKKEWDFPVIIDNMMNLELLFEASLYTNDSIYKRIAYQHAQTTLKNHFRKDNSTYHVVDYDTISGKVRSKVTHQGFADESSWARGQTWGIYGYTMAYRYTKDSLFLEQAKKTAHFFMTHHNLPDDGIPYWDFNAPKIPEEPLDVSAAAVMASALIELYSFTNEQKYLDFSDKIIENLSSQKYVIQSETDIPFILDHSTGNWPKDDEIDGPINYGDYYFLEALFRRKELINK
ncbi:glycoside hydrolase family 88 protein [Aquimarina addita]|uniref:Glycoside hydrolase family 88 protein n=1 Tax=Aquimarina addita TaxID=870485 RepID=A0ABP7XI79_9FLAO